MDKKRCFWVGEDPDMIKYHDNEWGVPIHDDRRLFEFLVLEGAQAGLSWKTVLKKRENYRRLFCEFDVAKISCFDSLDINRLLSDSGIIRYRGKIESTVKNAKKFMEIQKEFGSFDSYIWGFVDNKVIEHNIKYFSDIPTTIKESDIISKDLKKRGFSFVGSTICYAFMQAVGMVDDHEIDCFFC